MLEHRNARAAGEGTLPRGTRSHPLAAKRLAPRVAAPAPARGAPTLMARSTPPTSCGRPAGRTSISPNGGAAPCAYGRDMRRGPTTSARSLRVRAAAAELLC